MDEAQRLENDRLVAAKETVARELAGSLSLEKRWDLVRGHSLPEFADYSCRRIRVMQRACLILLDVARERHPTDPDEWTREKLEARIDNMNEVKIAESQKRQPESVKPWVAPARPQRLIVTKSPWDDR